MINYEIRKVWCYMYKRRVPNVQIHFADLYYNEDLSLSEIAEPLGISRQGVRDAIKRGEKLLISMEERLGLVNRFLNVEDSMEEIIADVKSMRQYEKMYVHSRPISEGLKALEEKLKAVTKEL